MSFQNNNSINICFASDDNYIQHCACAITSILLNSDNTSYFNFIILNGGISKKNKTKIIKLKNIKDFSITFYDMKSYDFSELPLNRHYISIAAYYRILIVDIIPANIKKIIYLDSDIIVKEDINKLWNVDLEDYLVAAVEDEGSITQMKRLGFSLNANYFNSGIIIFNVDKLRNFDFYNKCVKAFEENIDIITLQDQDILNIVLNGAVKFLDVRWNCNSRIYMGNELEKKYSKEDEKIASDNPAIIHFTDFSKPWNVGCRHPLKSEYFKYLRLTPWKINYLRILFANKIFSKYDEREYCIYRILGIKISTKPLRLKVKQLNREIDFINNKYKGVNRRVEKLYEILNIKNITENKKND